MAGITVTMMRSSPPALRFDCDPILHDGSALPTLQELEMKLHGTYQQHLADDEDNEYDGGDHMEDIQCSLPGSLAAESSTPVSSRQASASFRGHHVGPSDPSRSPFHPGVVRSLMRTAELAVSNEHNFSLTRRGGESLERSSGSPEVKILTPDSSHQDYVSFAEDSPDGDGDACTPISGVSPAASSTAGSNEWMHSHLRAAGPIDHPTLARMNNQPSRQIRGSGAPERSATAQDPSVVPRSLIETQLRALTPNTLALMDGDSSDQYGHFSHGSNRYSTTNDDSGVDDDQIDYIFSDGTYGNIVTTNYESPLEFHFNNVPGFEQQSQRTGWHPQQLPIQYDQHMLEQQYPVAPSQLPHQQHQIQMQQLILQQQQQQQRQAQPQPIHPSQLYRMQVALANRPPHLGSSPQEQHAPNLRPTPQSVAETRAPTRPPPQEMPKRPVSIASNASTSRKAPRVHAPHMPTAPRIKPARDASGSPQSSHSGVTTNSSTRTLQPAIVKSEPGLTSGGSNSALLAPPQKVPKGGRKSGLSESAKQRTTAMRHSVACWKCVIQRDRCDGNFPCNRCSMRAQKGQGHFFGCNRTKLPDLVRDFLPPSMTLMHERQTIEDTVGREVLEWSMEYPIDIFLTTGYGPALMWRVYEFKPRTPELLTQLQYFQNPGTGKSESRPKWSPPFALLKLDDGDDTHVQAYLDMLMTEDCLRDLGWACFEEEAQIDDSAFQCNLLDFMCKLYLETDDHKLRQLLHLIIRMMIITYIMGHTLTICEETLPSVLKNVRFSKRPTQTNRHTSPRLANRQLKFFFAILRLNIYDEILNRQQQTFHQSKKEATWLTSFCAILGLAMVLEEVQRTLQIQADAKIRKNEMAPELAIPEACNACDRIDERFQLLLDLFQGKYRDKTWGRGSFGPSTPNFSGSAEHRFLTKLRLLVEEKVEYLESREKVECRPENQCVYTSRLVARFLLPFLGLPS